MTHIIKQTSNSLIPDSIMEFARGKKKSLGVTNNCVIYTRVSTKEQADTNMSLTTQKKICDEYAEKKGYTVAGHFGGTYESAKTDERKEFNRMLEFVKKSKEKVSYILVYSVDRFSRSGANAIYITDQLKKQGVLVVSVTQYSDTGTSNGSFNQNIQYLFAEWDNQNRREKCMTGTKEALLSGKWCNMAPMGYDIIRKDGKRMIVVNKVGEKLRKAFLWKANTDLSIKEICQKLNGLGVKIYHQKLSQLFRNPFYCGFIAHAALEGQLIQGQHEAMVTPQLFLKVNDILSENVQGYTVKHENEAVPLKNFVKCGTCGDSMPGYIVKKKGLWYYKCRRVGCCNNKSAKELHNSFLELLKPFQISLSDKATKLIYNIILKQLSTEIKEKASEYEQINMKLSEVNSNLDMLEKKYILDKISEEQYLKFRKEFFDERKTLSTQLEKNSLKVSNLNEEVEKLVQISQNLPSLWTSSDYIGKVRLQKFIFPEGISYNKKNNECRTTAVNPLFKYLACISNGFGKNKKGANEEIFNSASLVGPAGIEPATL